MNSEDNAPIPKKKLGRASKLKSKVLVDALFAKGKAISSYPIRLIYLPSEEAVLTPKVLFSVSKRNFKKAVDRNRIKRQLHELYRLHQAPFFVNNDKRVAFLAFIYTGKEKLAYSVVEKKLILALERLTKTERA